MANESDLKYDGEQILFADHATDFGAGPATANNSLVRTGTPVDVQLDLTGVAASGGGRASTKSASLGDPRVSIYTVDACIEFEASPTDGGTVDFYWAASHHATTATGNGGEVTGSDASYTGSPGKLGQLTRIGSLTVRNATVSIGYVGRLMPRHQYGTLVVINNTDAAMRSTATAMDETHIVFTPLAYVPGG